LRQHREGNEDEKHVASDRYAIAASARSIRALSEAGLDQVAAAGGSSTGSSNPVDD
jgi:hypothetical protein